MRNEICRLIEYHKLPYVRLLSATTSQGSTDLTESTYTYNGAGQATRIVDETLSGSNAGDRDVRCLQYDNDQRLWTVIRSSCGSAAGSPNREFAREFRYDQDGRQRYLVRDRSPSNLLPLETGQYREYFGNRIHADLAVTVAATATAAPVRRYAFGYGLIGWQEPVSGAWHIAHADLLGSTRVITDGAGNVAGHITYSAFGETLASDFDTADARTRYGFCGSWGYETDELEDPAGNIGLIHVGARYYDPHLGRFIQRDPIGIDGGMNAYVYSEACPSLFVDPSGHSVLLGEEVGRALECKMKLEQGKQIVIIGKSAISRLVGLLRMRNGSYQMQLMGETGVQFEWLGAAEWYGIQFSDDLFVYLWAL